MINYSDNKLNKLLIDGAKKYYDYLDENGKGLILFDILGVERIFEEAGKKCLYKVRLDKKLKNTEGLQIQVRDKIYLPNHVKIILWDEDRKEMIIQVINKQAKEELAGLEDFDVAEVKVVLDLKYLVARTGKWFESHDLILPTTAHKLDAVKTFDPTSKSQHSAVEFCLAKPFSYIWGAPGTGKTKFALTNATLNLFRAGKRVVIVAPTNNAIEQVMRCVIDRFDQEKISRSNIIRLGMPSKTFAEAYPEVVEVRGVSQIVAGLVKQKELLENILKFKDERETFAEMVEVLKKRMSGKSGELSKSAEMMLEAMRKEFAEKERLYAGYEADGGVEIKRQIENLGEQLTEAEKQSTDERINKLNIVGCTVDYYIGMIPQGVEFDHIFLDEAGYCNLAKAATLFASDTPVTFLGDHFQLPPVCEMDDDLISGDSKEVFTWAQSALYLADLIENGAETEYMRYIKKMPPTFNNLPKINLTETYRFGQNLLDILCKSVYGAKLTSQNEGIIIEVINAPKKSFADKKRANPDEAEAIKQYCLKNFAKLENAAILTPYKNQVSLLRKLCYRFIGDNISTVHASQGREWDTVILSVCDTTDKYFTNSNNIRSNGKLILNTAISRVKKRLVIVCDENYWQTQEGQLLTELIRNKTVRQ